MQEQLLDAQVPQNLAPSSQSHERFASQSAQPDLQPEQLRTICAADCPHHILSEYSEPTAPTSIPSQSAPGGMPDDEILYDLADLFRVFGDSTRIKILYALHDEELCVCDIANRLELSQSAVSHQLRVLKDSKLVRFRRDGKTVYYALDDDHVRSILSLGMEHVEE